MSNHKNNAKFTFFYLLALLSLGFMVVAIGIIIFQIINKNIVDLVGSSIFNSNALQFAISVLVISAPVYYVMMWNINKNLHNGELDLESPLRRWLTYLIIFIASGFIMGWLIAIINIFLSGELTLKFILKAATVLIIASTILGYYIYDIKRKERKKSLVIKIFFFASVGFVLTVFIASLFFIDSPQVSRDRKADQKIISDFEKISAVINDYYLQNKTLPKNLDLLLSNDRFFLDKKDLSHFLTDKQEETYQYNIIDQNSFELCATFKTNNFKDNNIPDYKNYGEHWKHDLGYQCLQRTVRKDIVPTPILQ